MAILTVGILALVRVFPAGQEATEEMNHRTIASRHLEDVVANYRSEASTLPSAVASLATAVNLYVNPESLPTDTPTPTYDSLRNLTRVVGEARTVLNDGTDNYVLVRYPPLAGITVSATGELLLNNPRLYQDVPLTEGVDYTVSYPTGEITISNTTSLNHWYRVNYSLRDTLGTTAIRSPIRHVQDEHFLVDAGSTIAIPVRAARPTTSGGLGSAFDGLLPGSVRVTYEAPITIAAADVSMTHGRILLPAVLPAGAASPVKVDYTVNPASASTTDCAWQWVTENATETAAGSIDLAFADLDSGNPIYVTHKSATTNVVTPVTVAPGGTSTTPALVSDMTPADYQNGRIPNAAAGAFRVTYKTLVNWGLQVMRAPATFVPATTSDLAFKTYAYEPYRQYAAYTWYTPNTLGDANGDGIDDGRHYIGFYRSNAGRTVVVDYIALVWNGATYTRRSIAGELHVVSPQVPATPAFDDYPYQVQLNYPYLEVLSVRGTSVTARATWFTKGKYHKLAVTSYFPATSM